MIYNSRTDTDVCQDIIFIFCIFFYMHRQKSGRKTEYNKTVKGS